LTLFYAFILLRQNDRFEAFYSTCIHFFSADVYHIYTIPFGKWELPDDKTPFLVGGCTDGTDGKQLFSIYFVRMLTGLPFLLNSLKLNTLGPHFSLGAFKRGMMCL